MGIAIGSTITIDINGTDYTNEIDTFSESGGEKTYKTIRHLNNNISKIQTGGTDFELSFHFRMNETKVYDLFDNNTAIDITITFADESIVTWSNMIVKSVIADGGPEEIMGAELMFSAPYYDSGTDTVNRSVV